MGENAEKEFRRSWRIVIAVWLGAIFGLNGISYAAFGVLVDPLAAALGRSTAAISAWVTFLFAGSTLASPLVGWLADRFGTRRVVLAGAPLFALAWVVAGAAAPRLWLFYCAAAVIGCVGTAVSSLTYSRVVNTWFVSGRGMALGIMSSGIGLSYLLGPPLVQKTVDASSWRYGFFLLGVANLIPWLLGFAWLHERREKAIAKTWPVETGRSVREALGSPVLWILGAALFFYGLSAAAVTLNLVPFLSASGLSRAAAARDMVVLGIFSITGRIAIGWVIDRLPAVLVCAFILVIEAGAFTLFGFSGSRYARCGIAATGLAFGGEVSCIGYIIARYFGVRYYGSILGWISVIGNAGIALGPPCFALLRQRTGGYTSPFLATAATALAAAAAFAWLKRYPYFVAPDSAASKLG